MRGSQGQVAAAAEIRVEVRLLRAVRPQVRVAIGMANKSRSAGCTSSANRPDRENRIARGLDGGQSK
jgi:hypothetical protein